MKNYKRLTSEQGFNCRECVDGECQTPDMFCPYRCECERYNRLYNLEDKIERGEIDYVAEKDKEIARLTAENDKLRARLKNAVELPAIVMIERTLVDGKFKHTQKAQAFNGRIGVMYSDKTRWGGLLVDICSEKTFDYEPAKARLAEIKAEAKLKEIGGNN